MIRGLFAIAVFVASHQVHARSYEKPGDFKTTSGRIVRTAGSRYCFETAPGAQSSDPTMTYANIVIAGQKGEPVFIKKDLLLEMNCDKKVSEIRAPVPAFQPADDEETAAGS